MAISCGVKCAKSVLLTFNLLFWLSGVTLLVLGMWIILEPAKGYLVHMVAPAEAPHALHLYLAYVLVGLGGTILLVGFIGCCSALQESKCLIATFFVFLVVIMALEVSVAVAVLMFRDHTTAGLETRLIDRLRTDYGHADNKIFSDAVDFTQYKFNCCGIRGDDDYATSQWVNSSNNANSDKFVSVPVTCCILNNANAEEAWRNPEPQMESACQAMDGKGKAMARHQKGCMEELELHFKRESTMIIVAGIATAALEVLGMVFSLCLCRNLSDDM